jgi:glycosyltransferase involved in cell wall biosynthesis
MSRRILVVAHNHPSFHPGGTEMFAHDLFRSYRAAGNEAFFLGATNKLHREPHPGTSLQALPGRTDEFILWAPHFDRFMLSQVDLHGVVPDLTDFLRTLKPDVVHIHHFILLGAEFPALVKRILPDAQVVMTLHDYYPICTQDGVMVRTKDHHRCMSTDANACRSCFPDIPASRFALREIYLKTHMEAIDQFIAPSSFLRDRYVAWGIEPGRIEVLVNGYSGVERAAARATPDGRRNVFGYFGNFNPWKGVDVLLRAARLAADAGADFQVRLHGAALFQTEEFAARIEKLAGELPDRLIRLGAYERDEVPALMAEVDWVVTPSIWWENAPLTISEAQFHRRPVIASGIGGMAELIRNDVNGLHVRPGDVHALSRAIIRASDDADLWSRLSAASEPPPAMDLVAARHLAFFESLQPLPKREAA